TGGSASAAGTASTIRFTPSSRRLGCYIHIPFCAVRCGYCSFNTAPYAPDAMRRFMSALCSEIDLHSKNAWRAEAALRSVFLGGGTPSLATPQELDALLARLRQRFAVERDAEVTVECNPESSSLDGFVGYRRAGVTRISLGVQSLDDRIL